MEQFPEMDKIRGLIGIERFDQADIKVRVVDDTLRSARATQDWNMGGRQFDERWETVSFYALSRRVIGKLRPPLPDELRPHLESSRTVGEKLLGPKTRPRLIVEVRDEQGEFYHSKVLILIHKVPIPA
jgi:hypothetical protein